MNKSRALRCRSSDKRFWHVASHSYPAAQKGQRITRYHGAAHKRDCDSITSPYPATVVMLAEADPTMLGWMRSSAAKLVVRCNATADFVVSLLAVKLDLRTLVRDE